MGLELVPGTLVELLIVYPPHLTLKVSVAHDKHWVLSRQTLTHKPTIRIASQNYRPFLSAEESQMPLFGYSDEVARTRSILDQLVTR